MGFVRTVRAFLRRPAIRFWLVSAIGTPFSYSMYLFLMTHTNTGMVWSSRWSSLFAQAVDFYPHKRLTFKEHRHDSKTFTIEMSLYATQAFVFLWRVEPFTLRVVTDELGLGIMQTWVIAHIITGTLRFLTMRLIFLPFKRRCSPSPLPP